ncbi:MAG: hypothetical protein H7Z38_13220 [Rubrivivax sp.]|nr:hypothetical protein [Pyrinomonadaceae bacterium]
MRTSVEQSIVAGCVGALRQAQELLERLGDQLYADAEALPIQSGVGGHLRHCLDFYQSFLSGVRERRVDYNRRGRDLLVERDRSFALFRIQITIEELLALAPYGDGTPLLVSLEDAPAESGWCESSVGRELQFLLSHTVHHYALIALLLRLRGFEPGREFGVAPSTLEHWKKEAACAR